MPHFLDAGLCRPSFYTSLGELQRTAALRAFAASKLFALFRFALARCRCRLLNYLRSLDLHGVERGPSDAAFDYKEKRASSLTITRLKPNNTTLDGDLAVSAGRSGRRGRWIAQLVDL